MCTDNDFLCHFDKFPNSIVDIPVLSHLAGGFVQCGSNLCKLEYQIGRTVVRHDEFL